MKFCFNLCTILASLVGSRCVTKHSASEKRYVNKETVQVYEKRYVNKETVQFYEKRYLISLGDEIC